MAIRSKRQSSANQKKASTQSGNLTIRHSQGTRRTQLKQEIRSRLSLNKPNFDQLQTASKYFTRANQVRSQNSESTESGRITVNGDHEEENIALTRNKDNGYKIQHKTRNYDFPGKGINGVQIRRHGNDAQAARVPRNQLNGRFDTDSRSLTGSDNALRGSNGGHKISSKRPRNVIAGGRGADTVSVYGKDNQIFQDRDKEAINSRGAQSRAMTNFGLD